MHIFFVRTQGIHAREWIAPITALYVVDRLVEAFRSGSDSDVTAVDWYIMPMLNPDGYEYSHTTDRLWRKNRASPPKGERSLLKTDCIQCKIVEQMMTFKDLGSLNSFAQLIT